MLQIAYMLAVTPLACRPAQTLAMLVSGKRSDIDRIGRGEVAEKPDGSGRQQTFLPRKEPNLSPVVIENLRHAKRIIATMWLTRFQESPGELAESGPIDDHRLSSRGFRWQG